jgi:hypothetical protein
MDSEYLTKEIQTSFPDAQNARLFFTKQNVLLEEQYGFTPENTLFAEGGCCDEVNEPEYRVMDRYWGNRFKFGGLAGYCHGGKTGLSALSHHAPEAGGKKNLIILAGPHIGYHLGNWGKILRHGQTEISACCGSLAAAVQTGYEILGRKSPDVLDRQQQTVEQLLLPYLESCSRTGKMADIVDATKYLMQRIDSDLLAMVQDLEAHFEGRIALITGITINTERGNYFSTSHFKVHGRF